MFLPEEFEKVCEDLLSFQTEAGWEFFTETHGIVIYRLYNEASGLYQYKIHGLLDDVDPETCAQVYMDLEYRKTWDTYVNELREIKDDGRSGIYWQINFPFFMSNRDYVYARELREMDYKGQKIYAVLARSEAFPSEPERTGVIRVDDYMQSAALMSDGKNGTKAFMHYYDNPKGSIPAWIINWGAKSGVPAFMTDMQKACRGYRGYLKTKQST